MTLPPILQRTLRTATTGSLATALALQLGFFITGPLLARMLGVDDRGHLAVLMLWPALLSQLVPLGYPLAITYEVAQAGHVPAGLLRRSAPLIAGQTAALLLLQVVAMAVSAGDGRPAFEGAMLLALLLGPLYLARDYGLALLQGLSDFRRYNAIRLVFAVLYPGVVALAYALGFADVTQVLAMLLIPSLAMVVAVAAGVWVVTRHRQASSERTPSTGSLVRFGLKGFLGSMSSLDGLRLDQLMLAVMLPRASLGLYVVAIAFAGAARIPATSVGHVAYARTASEHDERRAYRIMWRFTGLTAGAVMLVLLALELAVPALIPPLFGQDFEAAGTVARLVLPGYAFLSVRRVLSDGLRGCGLPLPSTIAELTSMTMLVPSIWWLGTRQGVEGVALAVTLSEAVALAVLAAIAWSHWNRVTRAAAVGQGAA